MEQVLDIGLVITTLRLTTPLLLAALGGLLCERSGVINIGLEGMMLVGALGAALGSYYTGNPWVGLIVAMLAGGALGGLHAYLSVRWSADQVLSSLSMNILAIGATGFLLQALFRQGGNTPEVPALPDLTIPILSGIPILGRIVSGQNFLVYVAMSLPFIVHVFLHRTPWGIWVKAAGEHPRAVETFGLNVLAVRYLAVTAGGVLAGLGGAYLSIGQMRLFSENMTSGRGFIAVAAVIFGKWQPLGVLAATLAFALFDALQLTLQITIGNIIPKEVFLSLPYIVTLIVLTGVVGKAISPASVGQPYEREGR